MCTVSTVQRSAKIKCVDLVNPVSCYPSGRGTLVHVTQEKCFCRYLYYVYILYINCSPRFRRDISVPGCNDAFSSFAFLVFLLALLQLIMNMQASTFFLSSEFSISEKCVHQHTKDFKKLHLLMNQGGGAPPGRRRRRRSIDDVEETKDKMRNDPVLREATLGRITNLI